MTNALIIHGTCDAAEYFSSEYPSLSNSHWLPWLQKQLIIAGYATQTPEMPLAYQPDYGAWVQEFKRYTVSSETTLVGHSCGAGFLLRWLTEHPEISPSRVVLVAPWLDPERSKTEDFFDFDIDLKLAAHPNIHLLHSDNDDDDIVQSVRIIRTALPGIHYHEFKDYGHFCYGDMGTEAFPELLAIVLRSK